MRRFAELPDYYLEVSHWAPHLCGGYYEQARYWIGPGGPFYAVPKEWIKPEWEKP